MIIQFHIFDIISIIDQIPPKNIYDFIGIAIKFDQIEAITTNEGISELKEKLKLEINQNVQ
jgi:chemotaxis protein CheY-P-specific phosphatase CheC